MSINDVAAVVCGVIAVVCLVTAWDIQSRKRRRK